MDQPDAFANIAFDAVAVDRPGAMAGRSRSLSYGRAP